MPIPDHYYGRKVATYEQGRASSPMWRAEQHMVGRFLEGLPAGSRCLDVPLGTGRFLPFYREHDHKLVGVDISLDMLQQSKHKLSEIGFSAPLVKANIFDLPFTNSEFDIAICTRLLTWFSLSQIENALGELARVSNRMIVTAHVWKEFSEIRSHPLLALQLTAERVVQRAKTLRGIPLIQHHPESEFAHILDSLGLRVDDACVFRDRPLARYKGWSLTRSSRV
jgi:ubiquinone/menaquinone biosynthesis C-methylase UbiE